jgi:hypothetical protein
MVIPNGVSVIADILSVHRNPKYWGGDANEFRPERFRDGVAAATGNHPSAFIPFGQWAASVSWPEFCSSGSQGGDVHPPQTLQIHIFSIVQARPGGIPHSQPPPNTGYRL